MIRHFLYFIPFFLSLTSFGCKESTTSQVPNTPEAIVRQWQQYYDNNQFEEAGKLSTPNGISFLGMVESFLDEESGTASVLNTTFLELNCQESNGKAICYFLIEEEGETIRDSIHLLEIDGQWLVDIPEEVFQIDEDNEMIEKFFDELEHKELQVEK